MSLSTPVPRSPPVFPGDRQHDLRDHLLACRLDTIGRWVGRAAGIYLRAAGILRLRHRDALAITLDADPRFDARTLVVAHDHMAAHWRARYLPEAMTGGPLQVLLDDRPCLRHSYRGLRLRFQHWLLSEVDRWSDQRPDVLHLFLLASVMEHTRTGRSVEAEFYYTLVALCPVLGVTAPDPLPDRPE